MSLILGFATVILTWMGLGRPLHPSLLLTMIPLGLWVAGLTTKTRILLSLGFWGFSALAGILTVFGETPFGLAALGATLLAWDGLSFWGRATDARKRHLWSAFTVAVGMGLALTALFLRMAANFWAIMGALFLAWLLLRLFVRETAHGGDASGKRSTSVPTR